MKKIKMVTAAAMFCAAAFAGYTAYDKATMTDQEKLIQANVEALTRYEFDDVEIVCDANEGRCYIEVDREVVWGIIPIPMYKIICGFSGYQDDFCIEIETY